MGGLPQKEIEILGSEKCILVDSVDGFAMDNIESKTPLRSDRRVRTPPDPPPVSATASFRSSSLASTMIRISSPS